MYVKGRSYEKRLEHYLNKLFERGVPIGGTRRYPVAFRVPLSGAVTSGLLRWYLGPFCEADVVVVDACEANGPPRLGFEVKARKDVRLNAPLPKWVRSVYSTLPVNHYLVVFIRRVGWYVVRNGAVGLGLQPLHLAIQELLEAAYEYKPICSVQQTPVRGV